MLHFSWAEFHKVVGQSISNFAIWLNQYKTLNIKSIIKLIDIFYL